MGDFELQALRFPSGAHDDILDALHGVCRLLEYPKQSKKAIPEDSIFERVRQIYIESKKPQNGRYKFGGKIGGRAGLPFTTDYK